ncbi:uncharacterized protein LOC144109906 [Amblyomma americanum]|uniref:Uncharacterized protein n=1 Tax=Amblyomma americanum TaxID=6943 RepID=A0AAQ4DFG0_AMBAM
MGAKWWLTIVLSAAPCIVACPCSEEVCTQFKYTCRPLPKVCDGRITYGAGFCGCCQQCVRKISIGDPCYPSGLCPGPTECAENLYCDPDQKACLPFPVPSASNESNATEDRRGVVSPQNH